MPRRGSRAAGQAISPWFMYRRVISTLQDGGTVTELEINFNLGQGQAIEIAASWLGVAAWNIAAIQAVTLTSGLELSLHRRTGTLTDETTPSVDGDFTQAEVLQDAFVGFGGASTAAAGGAFGQILMGQPFINWSDILGEPLLIAANLTMRADPGGAITGAITYNGIYTKLLYRYVRVTDAQLVRAFISRQ